MPIQIPCPCGRRFWVEDRLEGQTVNCPLCGVTNAIPAIPGRRRAAIWGKLFYFGAVGLFITAYVAYRVGKDEKPKSYAPSERESDEQRYRSAAEAYAHGSGAPIEPTADEAAVRALIDAFVSRQGAGDGAGFCSRLHLRRMLAEVAAAGFTFPIASRRQEEALLKEFSNGLAKGIAENASTAGFRWTGVRVLRVTLKPERGEADAYGRIRIGDVKLKVRFWAIKEDGVWRLFDWELLNEGIRASTLLAELLSRLDARTTLTVPRAMDACRAAAGCIASGDADGGLEKVAEARRIGMPKALLPSLDVVEATARGARGEFDEAFTLLNRAAAAKRDLPLVHHLRGAFSLMRGDYLEAIQSEEEYMRLLGPDAEAYLNIGAAYDALGKDAEAEEAFRKGIACDEDDVDNRYRLALTLIEEDEGRALLLDAYARAHDASVFFTQAVVDLEEASAYEPMLDLARAHSLRSTDDLDGPYHEGLALRHLERFAESEKVFLKLLDRDEDGAFSYWEELAYIVGKLGRASESAAYAEKLLAESPDYANGFYLRAFARALLKDTLPATDDLKKALDLDAALYAFIEAEPAFEELRYTPAVQQLLKEARSRAEN